jgi:voltage-gated potassium channel
MSFQKQLATYLDPFASRVGRIISLAIAGLVVAFCFVFVAETYPLPETVRPWLNAFDLVVLTAFTVEYLLRFVAAENKLKYLFSWYSVIDLLAIVPFWLGTLDIRFIRTVRLLGGLRVLRMIRFLEQMPGRKGKLRADQLAIFRIVYTVFAIIFVYSGLIYQVEHVANSKNFRTFLDAFYFAVVTMTTVGFGDVTPITEGGRLFTVLMILTGVAIIPWQVGDLIKRLARSNLSREVVCAGCGWAWHEADAQFCSRCGTQLPISPASAVSGVEVSP